MSIDRVAGNEEIVELQNITTDGAGVSTQATLATAEGAVTKSLSLSDEGLVATEAVITEAGVVAGTLVVAVDDEDNKTEAEEEKSA